MAYPLAALYLMHVNDGKSMFLAKHLQVGNDQWDAARVNEPMVRAEGWYPFSRIYVGPSAMT